MPSSPYDHSEPIRPVRYALTLDQAAWRIAAVTYTEALHEPYQVIAHVLTDQLDTDLESLLGTEAELLVERDPLSRTVHGIVHRADYLGIKDRFLHVRVYVAPALWLLSKGRNCRIFQDSNVPEIVQQVVDPLFRATDRAIRMELRHEHLPLEYCVQYGESDLDFATRVMEQEGITYYFDHTGDRETMVLVDDNHVFPESETLDEIPEVPISAAGELDEVESIESFVWARTVRAARVIRDDWDWEAVPPRVQRAEVDSETPGDAGRTHEVYEFGDRRYGSRNADTPDLAKRHLETLCQGDRVGQGDGNVLGFAPGRTFTLVGHADPERDTKYLITRVIHSGDVPGAGTSAGGGAMAGAYANTFECIPLDAPFHPDKATARPRILGPQTGVVDGPAGQEVFTDGHGRVKVRMHWDRGESPGEGCSCWMRVVQAWAGSGFGFQFVPRVGMEVVVNFIEGDPDRPLVAGAVFNAANPAPHQPEVHSVTAAIRTSSSPGGGGYNELKFRDDAGAEEIALRAQRDLNEHVLHDHSLQVDGAQTIAVTNDRTKTIDGSEYATVRTDRIETIEGSQLVRVVGSHRVMVEGGNPKGLAPPTVLPGAELSVKGTYHVSATEKIVFKVGDTAIELTPKAIKLLAQAGCVSVSDGKAEVKLESGTVEATAPAKVVLCGGTGGTPARLCLQDTCAEIAVSDSSLKMDGTATLEGTDACLEGTSTATVKGKAKAELSSEMQTEIEGKSVTAQAGAAKIHLDGTMVHINS